MLTSYERNMFETDKENSNENYEMSEADPNKFFSAQRPEREDT